MEPQTCRTRNATLSTRIRKKRAAVTLRTRGGSEFGSSPLETSCHRLRCWSSGPEAPNHLELLPQEILVRILSCVDHGDLRQLIFVSKPIHDAALIAKEHHFAFRTPSRKHSFGGDARGEDGNYQTPKAPRRVCRSRPKRRDLSSIGVALFK